jgi:hypothetical protein
MEREIVDLDPYVFNQFSTRVESSKYPDVGGLGAS